MSLQHIPFFQLPPIGSFSMVMGLAGLSLVWGRIQSLGQRLSAQQAELPLPLGVLLGADSASMAGLASVLSSAAALAAALAFVLVLLLYVRKLLARPHAALVEWSHPVQSAFFSAFSVSLILMGALALEHGLPGAPLLLALGAALHLVLMLLLLRSWMDNPGLHPQHISPVWFIPAVGNVVVPVVGVPLGWVQLSWWYFGLGMMFWVILLILVLGRLLFVQPPMPPRLLPSLCILLAPPAVGLVSWLLLTGQMQSSLPLDPLSHIFLGLGLFFAAFLLLLIPRFARLEFSLSWWAFSFPVCAFAISLLSYWPHAGGAALAWLTLAAVALASLIVLGLLVRTVLALVRAEHGFVEVPAHS